MTTTPNTFLSDEEVRVLTGRKVRSSQVRALTSMGIEHRVRPDGSVAILRNHIDRVFDPGQDFSSKRQAKVKQPNWAAI